MENLPNNVINQIMLYLSTPSADIIKNSYIFEFMALRLGKYKRQIRGSPFNCGLTDSWMHHRYFCPRLFTITPQGQRSTKMTLEQEEHDEYVAAYLHASRLQYHLGPSDLFPTWRIKGNRFRFKPQEHPLNPDPESGTETDTDSEFEPDSETETHSDTETISDTASDPRP